jgi:hypothetical protein
VIEDDVGNREVGRRPQPLELDTAIDLDDLQTVGRLDQVDAGQRRAINSVPNRF